LDSANLTSRYQDTQLLGKQRLGYQGSQIFLLIVIPKVCDFGLSRFNTTQNMQTMNKIVGTVNYLAPEVYLGETYTDKADVYR
jgi:serine/threonine protein kinase